MSKNLAVMLSIGDRPWAQYAAQSFSTHAKKYGYDFRIIESPPEFQLLNPNALSGKLGRESKEVFASKSYWPYFFLVELGYEKVMFVDDTCIINPETENVFERVVDGECAFTNTSERHAEISFSMIDKFVEENERTRPALDSNFYMNSGVMLYTRAMADALSPKKIYDASFLLNSIYPHQTLSYYLLANADVSRKIFPKSFNKLPRMKDVEPKAMQKFEMPKKSPAWIYHVTTAFAYRYEVVESIALEFTRRSSIR